MTDTGAGTAETTPSPRIVKKKVIVRKKVHGEDHTPHTPRSAPNPTSPSSPNPINTDLSSAVAPNPTSPNPINKNTNPSSAESPLMGQANPSLSTPPNGLSGLITVTEAPPITENQQIDSLPVPPAKPAVDHLVVKKKVVRKIIKSPRASDDTNKNGDIDHSISAQIPEIESPSNGKLQMSILQMSLACIKENQTCVEPIDTLSRLESPDAMRKSIDTVSSILTGVSGLPSIQKSTSFDNVNSEKANIEPDPLVEAMIAAAKDSCNQMSVKKVSAKGEKEKEKRKLSKESVSGVTTCSGITKQTSSAVMSGKIGGPIYESMETQNELIRRVPTEEEINTLKKATVVDPPNEADDLHDPSFRYSVTGAAYDMNMFREMEIDPHEIIEIIEEEEKLKAEYDKLNPEKDSDGPQVFSMFDDDTPRTIGRDSIDSVATPSFPSQPPQSKKVTVKSDDDDTDEDKDTATTYKTRESIESMESKSSTHIVPHSGVKQSCIDAVNGWTTVIDEEFFSHNMPIIVSVAVPTLDAVIGNVRINLGEVHISYHKDELKIDKILLHGEHACTWFEMISAIITVVNTKFNAAVVDCEQLFASLCVIEHQRAPPDTVLFKPYWRLLGQKLRCGPDPVAICQTLAIQGNISSTPFAGAIIYLSIIMPERMSHLTSYIVTAFENFVGTPYSSSDGLRSIDLLLDREYPFNYVERLMAVVIAIIIVHVEEGDVHLAVQVLFFLRRFFSLNPDEDNLQLLIDRLEESNAMEIVSRVLEEEIEAGDHELEQVLQEVMDLVHPSIFTSITNTLGSFW